MLLLGRASSLIMIVDTMSDDLERVNYPYIKQYSFVGPKQGFDLRLGRDIIKK